MDFFDVVGVMVRRWWVTIPVFVIGMGLVMRAAMGVGTEYESLGTVIFLPASVRIDFVGEEQVIQEWNPYLVVGSTRTLARAVPIVVSSSDTRRAAFEQGLSPNYELELDESEPIIYVSVKGDTPEQSSDTLDFVFIQMSEELARRQATDEFDPGIDFATMEIISEVRAIEDTSASVKVMGSLGIAAVLVTVMAAFGVEGLLEKRRGRLVGAIP